MAVRAKLPENRAAKKPILEPKSRFGKTALIILCIVVMGITLTAGLWPFSFYVENQVRWSAEQQGLYFGDHGMAVSSGKFAGLGNGATKDCSIEMWVQAAQSWDSSTLLAFYERQIPSRFELKQSGDDLAFAVAHAGPSEQTKKQTIYVDHVFRKGQRVFITLTQISGIFSIYVNGVLEKATRNLEMRSDDFTGILIVANTPYGDLSFNGTIRGLAIYDRGLDRNEVSEDYAAWKRDRKLIAEKKVQPYLLYLFDEQAGKIVHNVGKAGPDLEIPKYYSIFQPGFLVPFWREYRANWDYLKDLAINVFGLVPLGFCFAALMAWLINRERSLLYVTLLGFSVSLTIEILQSYMPTRFSGTTDLITNTSGTALGGWLYLNSYTQRWLGRMRLIRND
jgi:VanZ family protein